MSKKQKNNLDKTIIDKFSNFKSTPSGRVWENINIELTDQEIKENLETLEVPTSNRVWNNVIAVIETDQLFDDSLSDLTINPSANNWELIATSMQIDQYFENTFQDYKENPKPEIWDAIANHDFEAQCRSRLKNLEEKPNDENWEKIKRAIPAILPLRLLVPHFSRIAAVLILALALPFFIQKFVNTSSNLPVAIYHPAVETTAEDVAAIVPITTSEKTESQVINNSAVNQSKPSVQAVTVNTSPTKNVNRSIVTPPQVPVKVIVAEPSPDSEAILLSEIKSKVYNKLESDKLNAVTHKFDSGIQSLREINVTASSGSDNMFPVTSLKGTRNNSEFDRLKLNNKLFSLTDNKKVVTMLNYSGLYVYLATQISNTWMVNPEVQRQLSVFRTAKYVADTGGSFGLGFGYKFSPRVALEAGFRRSSLNQKFRENIPNKLFLTNEIKTVYNTFQALGKYTLNRIKTNRRTPVTSSLAFGLHYRNLKSVVQKTEINFDKSEFLNNEIGLVGGLDVDFYLNEKMTLNLGARASFGTDMDQLSTINSDSRVNNEYGLQAGVQYKISE